MFLSLFYLKSLEFTFASDLFSNDISDSSPKKITSVNNFPENRSLLIFVQSSDLFGDDALEKLQKLHNNLNRNEEKKGLSILSLYSREELKKPSIQKKILDSEFLRSKFIIPGFRGWIYITEEPLMQSELIRWNNLLEQSESVCMGDRIFQYRITGILKKDLFKILIAALIISLMMSLIWTRSLCNGSIIWIFNLLPPLFTMTIMNLLNLKMNQINYYIPVILIALTGSYCLHGLHRTEIDRTWKHEMIPLLLTTFAGFALLLFTPFPYIRQFAGICCLGILFITIQLFFLIPLIHSKEKSDNMLKFKKPAFNKYITLITLIILLIFIPLAYREKKTDEALLYTPPGSSMEQNSKLLEQWDMGKYSWTLIIDTQSEYGWVSEENWQSLQLLRDSLTESEARYIFDYSDLLKAEELLNYQTYSEDWTEEMIGESLELLSGSEEFNLDSFIDINWQTIKVSFFTPSLNQKELTQLKASINSFCTSQNWNFILSSGYMDKMESMLWINKNLLKNLLITGGLIFMYLFLLYKKLLPASLPLISFLSGYLVFQGCLGLFRLPESLTNIFIMSVLLGICVDDALYLTLSSQSGKNPDNQISSIIQTTITINACMIPLLMSSIPYFRIMGMLCILVFSITTSVTVFIIPGLMPENREITANENYT